MTQEQLEDLQKMVKNNSSLIWYSNNYDSLDIEAIAEAIYNNGTWEQIQMLHKIIGLKEAGIIFEKLSQRNRSNLKPIVRNYFTLYYDKHTS
jgi:hypothetical protein